MTTATTAGITDEQLEALTKGCWFDADEDIDRAPCWRREAVLSGGEKETQFVSPDIDHPRWRGSSGVVDVHAPDLDSVLAWCDDVATAPPPEGKATKQEDRFAQYVKW